MPHNSPRQQEPAEELLGGFASGKARWVFVSFVVFFALLFLLGWLIRYPDIHSVRVMVKTTDQVDRYFAGIAGEIAEIPVEREQEVDSGAVLLVWKHAGSWRDVLALGALSPPATEASIQEVDAYQLGELEEPWALARIAWEKYQLELSATRSEYLSSVTQRQLQLLDSLEQSLLVRKETQDEQLRLAEDNWQRYKRLATQNTVSQEALSDAERLYLEKRAAGEAIESGIVELALQREALEKEQLDIALQDNKVLRQKKANWDGEWRLLQSRQQGWVARHLCQAKRAGHVLFSRPLAPQQWLDEGEPVLAVAGSDTGLVLQAVGWLPADGAGRVKAGAEVQLRLDAFPYEEYGFLEAEVAYISPLSENESFLVEIALPNSLITGTGRSIPVGPEMPATARIFTAEKRLLARLWEGLKRR